MSTRTRGKQGKRSKSNRRGKSSPAVSSSAPVKRKSQLPDSKAGSEVQLPDLGGDFLDEDGLTEQQRRFVVEYIATYGNQTEAARRAYPNQTYDSARQQGSENLTKPHIKRAIHRILNPTRVASRMSVEAVRREVGGGVAFDPIELTNEDGSMRTIREMPPSARRYLKRYKQTDIRLNKDGPPVGVATDVEFTREFYVQMAAKMNKMLTDRVQHDLGPSLEQLLTKVHSGDV